jgi:hypothetical protein
MKEATENFLLIAPPTLIAKDVSFFKQRFRRILGHSYESEFSKAHISLFKYHDEHCDNTLYHIVDDVLLGFKPFTIYINGFYVLHHGENRTICLNIINKNSVSELMKKLTGQESLPYITLAKNLNKEDFNKLWPVIRNTKYVNSFKCESITVLREHDGAWTYYTDLPLAS